MVAPFRAGSYTFGNFSGKGSALIACKLNKMAAVGLASLLLSAAGCSTVKSGYSALRGDYDSWEGHSAEELLKSWGTPDATEELGPDYVAYIWLGDDGRCRRTFTALTGKITSYSESDCRD
jgi:hypothetical protein